MNQQRAKELLPVIQAFAEGKTIQSRLYLGQEKWDSHCGTDLTTLDFDSVDIEWRIKPAPPREWIVYLDSNNQISSYYGERTPQIRVCEVL